MRGLLRTYTTTTLALFLTSLAYTGLTINGNFSSVLIAGIFLTLGLLLLKPILTIITLPINIVTFGLFSIVINTLIIYLVTIIYPQVVIASFSTPEVRLIGITLESMQVSQILSYFLISATIYAISYGVEYIYD